MPFWKIAWRNMEQRGVASALTAFSMALGVAVMIAVIVIYSVAVRQFEQNAQGYHLIVGGKGGALQLVLSTVYHIGQPLYPIPYTYYQKFLPGGEFGKRNDPTHRTQRKTFVQVGGKSDEIVVTILPILAQAVL